MNTFYVYILYREDGRPFYVGKGTGRRWLNHERYPVRGRSHRDNIICDMQARGVAVPKRKVAEGLSNADACALEIRLIAEIGREPHGPLINQTRGGDGLVDPSQEIIAKIRAGNLGKKHPDDVRKKISINTRAALAKPDVKERHRKAISKAQSSPDYRARMSAAIRASHSSAEVRARISAGIRAALSSPEVRARISAKNRGRKHSEAFRAKMRAIAIGRVNSPEARAKMSASHRGKILPAAHRAKISAGLHRHYDRKTCEEKS